MRAVALGLVADDGYRHGLAATLGSVLEHLPAGQVPEVHVGDNGLSADTRHRLERVARRGGASGINWIQLPADALAGLGTAGHVTVASYARLLLPDAMPAHVGRLVYLDVDVLVVKDISPLFDLDMGTAAVAAVRDYAIGSVAQRWPEAEDGMRPGSYYNSGLLVVDVDRWRREGIGQRALAVAADPPIEFRFMDQDALNAVIGDWAELDPRWNVQQMLQFLERTPATAFRDDLIRQRDLLMREAAIFHFVSLPKPWYHGSFLPGTMPWARAFLRSGWFGPLERYAWFAPWLAKRVIRRFYR